MLTDNEIRLKIAELKGWRDLHPYNKHPLKPGAWETLSGLEGKDNNTDGTKDVPDWPRSIAVAWELVEEAQWYKLKKSQLTDGTVYHSCELFMHFPWLDDTGEAYADADTAARAICLAWLKLKGVEV